MSVMEQPEFANYWFWGWEWWVTGPKRLCISIMAQPSFELPYYWELVR